FANTSIDISDGLLTDLDKMINNQNLSYKLYLEMIPISANLRKIINIKKLPKINFVSNGDDYQVLFTASKNKRRIIRKIASNLRIKLTKIGSIQNLSKKSSIVDNKNMQINIKNKGFFHQF
ncbi:thiamine-phosphate kinase, partial [Pelagibacteraceae bacterium]|nr:thiamine-phosphate kinase [Pelagibacteraceae bacterium]